MYRLDLMLNDSRTAVRSLIKNRGITALAVLSIALGIGLTTALFSVINAVFLRPFPLARPEEVFSVYSRDDNQRLLGYSRQDYETMARAAAGLGEVIAYQRGASTLSGETGSAIVSTHTCSPNYFSTLGVHAALGRATLAVQSDGRHEVVLSHQVWMHQFGGDPDIVGSTILLNSKAVIVAGVMSPAFSGLLRGRPCGVWIGTDAFLESMTVLTDRTAHHEPFDILARLTATAAPQSIAARFDAAIRSPEGHKPVPAGAVGTWLEPISFNWQQRLIQGGAMLPVFALLLLVTCANAAQLRLAQAEARRKEMGVRLALGSSTWGLARLLLIETLLVSIAGAAGGLLLADTAIDLMSSTIRTAVGFDLGLSIDWRVGVFTLAATLFASVLAGITPVRHARRLDVVEILKSEEGTARAKNRLQRALIVGQTATSVLFFGFALLFTMSLRHAIAEWPGFDPGKLMVVIDAAPSLAMPRTIWRDQAVERLKGVPGVRAVTCALRLPLSLSGGGLRLQVESPGQAPLAVGANLVGPDYFTVMGTHLLAGREIGPSDHEGAARVAVVSQMLAREIFGARSPIGESLTIDGQLCQIVGMAEDAPSNNLHETYQPFVYLPQAQMPWVNLTLLIETAAEPESLLRPLEQELRHFDPGVVILETKTLRQHVDRALFGDRVAAFGSMGLGVLGFLLTAAGLFGLIQYSVNRRTREIGVRMALGAGPEAIQRSVLIESLQIVSPGIAVGLALLAGGAWFAQSALLGVKPLDPLAYTGCALAALGVALLATWLPARRATRVNPIVALRAE